MSTPTMMQSHAENFLNERHQLGYEVVSTGYTVRSFARHIDELGYQGAITIDVMADWARRDQYCRGLPSTWARRLEKLCSFARYLQRFDSRTEVPDDTTFGSFGERVAPHIYSDQEIIDLLAAARCLGPTPDGLRAATYETLFGLLASTGLRISEAVHLLNTDVDLKSGMLTIRQTKFAKSRQVPMHPSTVAALKYYRQRRNSYVEATDAMTFFVGSRGRCLGQQLSLRQVERVFTGLRDQLGLINCGAHNGVHIHDLRHTFVVRRVMLWHTQEVDVDQAMLALSTYVGHAMVSYTYWYLTDVPELMAIAASKFESFMPLQEVRHA
jgi:integrase